MLASITPLGERGRNRSWWTTVTAYSIGSIAGGAAMGTLFGAIGLLAADVLQPPAGWILAVGLIATAVLESDRYRRWLPTNSRQVNEDWLDTYRGWVVGAGFGFQLGAGLLTIVTSGSVYLTFIAAALTGSIGLGAAIGAVFGLARALPMLAVRRVTTPEALAGAHRRMAALAAAAHTMVTVTALGLAVVTVGVM